VVVGRSRTRAGRPHAVSRRPMLIHTCHAHAALCRGLKKSLSERHVSGMSRARHGMCESNTTALCKSNGKDKSKPLAARHGRDMGTAWARHGMCELAVKRTCWVENSSDEERGVYGSFGPRKET
jgi:hypothetical protein